MSFAKFFDAYVACALWCGIMPEIDEDGNPVEVDPGSYSREAIGNLETMRDEAKEFWADNKGRIGKSIEQAGHDFWLTRNRHGAGFWDRGPDTYSPEDARELTELSHAYGSATLYQSDTEPGKLFFEHT